MTTHHARPPKGGRHSAATPTHSRKALRELLNDVAKVFTIVGPLLSAAVGVLPPALAAPLPVTCATTTTIVDGMSDLEGLEEFGGHARWRDVLLRFPDGRMEPYRLPAMDGHLPGEFKRPLNESRTAYETFVLTGQDVDAAVYDWSDIEER